MEFAYPRVASIFNPSMGKRLQLSGMALCLPGASVGCASHHFRGVAPHQTNQPDWWVSNLFSRSMFEDEVICVFVLLIVFISCLGLRRCSFVLLFALSSLDTYSLV